MRTLIVGCGYVGTALGELLVGQGHEVWGLRRDVSALPPALHGIAADLNDISGSSLPDDLDFVVYAVSAGESSEAAYRRAYVLGLGNLLAILPRRALRRLFFTSSTAVYAQSDGSWVDETSDTAPTHFSGSITLEAENLVRSSGLPHTVLRCAGIYGPDRHRLIESVRRGTAVASDRFTNRIHREDLTGAIAHLMRTERDVELLVLSDDDPAPQSEVAAYLARQLGVAPPVATAALEAGARGGHKRCRNDRLKASGYRLAYPTYREGYTDIVAKLCDQTSEN